MSDAQPVAMNSGRTKGNTGLEAWKRYAFVPVLLTLWAVAVLVGMKTLFDHERAAGAAADAPRLWPEKSALPIEPGTYRLVMLAHPRCPCTRASLSELERLMTAVKGRANATVLFVKPKAELADEWASTDLWTSAGRISGAQAVLDEGGREAQLFGAKTSGQALLYSPRGELLFAGGMTPGRGHEGDNVGVRRIRALIEGGAIERAVSAVFGCSLFDGAL